MTESGGPEAVEAFAANEGHFRCSVHRPDLSAKSRTRRTQGHVQAWTMDEPPSPAGTLSYFVDLEEGRLATVRFCTYSEHRGKGCVVEMVKALRREFPGFSLSSSAATPTPAGRDKLISLHRSGLIDELLIDPTGPVTEDETDDCGRLN